MEMGGDGSLKIAGKRPVLLRACGRCRPDAFAPHPPLLAARALRDATVDDAEADRLFRRIVGRANLRIRHKTHIFAA